MEKQEKLIITAKEPEVATIQVESPPYVTICQCCLLCDNSRPFVNGYPPGPSPWVCDECKEAIAFVKEFRAGIKKVPADKAKEIEASIALL